MSLAPQERDLLQPAWLWNSLHSIAQTGPVARYFVGAAALLAVGLAGFAIVASAWQGLAEVAQALQKLWL